MAQNTPEWPVSILILQTRGQWPSANLLKVKADCNVVSGDETFEVFCFKKKAQNQLNKWPRGLEEKIFKQYFRKAQNQLKTLRNSNFFCKTSSSSGYLLRQMECLRDIL